MSTRFFTASCLLLAGSLLCASASAAPAVSVDTLLQQAVAGNWRSAANKARDQYRHPVQTLDFFGLKPDMTVIELSPGGGWYTEILAPVLHDHGQLIEAAAPLDSKSSFMHRMATRFSDKLKSDPVVFGKVKLVPFAPPDRVMLGADNSADMVLTFRNTHDWLNDSPESLAKVFQAAFKVLKKGGVFGVVEHRAKPGSDAETSSKTLHRIPEAYLIALGLKTGFKLEGESQINANPKDPKDINVHRLPPDLAGPDSEHAKMKAIGESDRMTLKFVKP
jgi:predicted methyltransferase